MSLYESICICVYIHVYINTLKELVISGEILHYIFSVNVYLETLDSFYISLCISSTIHEIVTEKNRYSNLCLSPGIVCSEVIKG